MRIRDGKIRIRDGKNSDPGSGMKKIRIRDKHPGFAPLVKNAPYRYNTVCEYVLLENFSFLL
jgi:hypothetical protein